MEEQQKSVEEHEAEASESLILDDIKTKLLKLIETVDQDQFEDFAFIFKLKGQVDPTPHLLSTGHFYDVAVMLNTILTSMQRKAVKDLGLN